mgnify:CR=1 FL=1
MTPEEKRLADYHKIHQERIARRDLEYEAQDRRRFAAQTIATEPNENLKISLMTFWAQKLGEEFPTLGFPYDDPIAMIHMLEATISRFEEELSEAH